MSNKESVVTNGYVLYRSWKLGGFEYRSDLISSDYMRRWTFSTPWGMLRLHNILRSDSREHFHDHPFDFKSVILKGGYTEYTPNREPRKYVQLDVNVKKAEDLHYLVLNSESVWTFVFAGLRRRDWGFQTEHGWVTASKYDDYLRILATAAGMREYDKSYMLRSLTSDELAVFQPASDEKIDEALRRGRLEAMIMFPQPGANIETLKSELQILKEKKS